MGSNLRVALVSGEYPPASLGGTAAVCFDLSLNLSKRKIHTTVFCGKSKKLSVEKVNDYLDVVRMPIISPPPRHLWFPLQNLSLLRGYLKDFDIIHNVDPKTGGVLASFKKELRSPFITHVHGCTHCETNVFLGSPIPFWSAGEFVGSVLEYPLNEYLLNSSLRASDHVVVCSDARLEEMKRRNPRLDYSKISVIYNGVDLSRERYVSVDNQDNLEDDCSILFWAGYSTIKAYCNCCMQFPLLRKTFLQ